MPTIPAATINRRKRGRVYKSAIEAAWGAAVGIAVGACVGVGVVDAVRFG